MSLELKKCVSLVNLQPQLCLAILVVERIYTETTHVQCVVTSVNDSVHHDQSKHYRGEAVDFRTKTVPRNMLPPLIDRIKAALGIHFDVLLEDFNGANEHLHVEWDPKSLGQQPAVA